MEEIYGKVYTSDSLLEMILYQGINCSYGSTGAKNLECITGGFRVIKAHNKVGPCQFQPINFGMRVNSALSQVGPGQLGLLRSRPGRIVNKQIFTAGMNVCACMCVCVCLLVCSRKDDGRMFETMKHICHAPLIPFHSFIPR